MHIIEFCLFIKSMHLNLLFFITHLQLADDPPPLPKRPTPGHPLYHYVVGICILTTVYM